jgi:ribose 5-phosphate isomerase B
MNRRTFCREGVLVAAAGMIAKPASASGVAPGVPMKLVIGSDHAGFPLKGPVIELLRSWGHTVNDVGTYSAAPVDFPDIARKVCGEILSGRVQRGIMVCGTGVGAAIAGNKVRGIRAALCHDTFCAHQCVEHDDVNLLCVGAWIIGVKLAEEILRAYLNARFSTDEDFRRRVRKLEELENFRP